MYRTLWLTSLMTLAAAACGATPGAPATAPPVTVSVPAEVGAVFREFYARYGGEPVFGPPLTADIPTDGGGHKQYFYNAVLIYNPNLQADERVSLAPLGVQYYTPDPPALPTPSPGAVYFAEYGHTVDLSFAEFFNLHGGVKVFGYPISEMHIEDGLLTQYFERASLYYDHRLQPGQRVVLGPLGDEECSRVNCYRLEGPLRARRAVCPIPTASAPTPGAPYAGAEIKTWVAEPVLGLGEIQTIYARLFDGGDAGIPGVQPCVTVETSGGNSSIFMTPTDSQGHTSLQFYTTTWKPGEYVLYTVTAAVGGQVLDVRHEFVVWHGEGGNP